MRRVRKLAQAKADDTTFKVLAQDWLSHSKPRWSGHHHERNEGLLRRILLPKLGNLPADEITDAMLLDVLVHAHAPTPSSASRARAIAQQIFRFGRDSRRCKANPAADLAGSSLLPTRPVEHFAALPQSQVGALLQALDAVANLTTKVAILTALYTGLRDGAIRGARWKEIDLAGKEWWLPAERMKLRRDFSTPIPEQLARALEQLKPVTDRGPESFIFASSGKQGYLAENTLRLALHRLGFKVTLHGFRSLLTDVLNEHDHNRDAIERQLDHRIPDTVRAAYLRSEFWEKRVKMMQWYADWCDRQRSDRQPVHSNVFLLQTTANG